MTPQQIIAQELEKISQELVQKHEALGMRASGRWANSLEVETTRHGAILWGEPYTWQLIHGRRPGKFPPLKAIEQWIYDKGIAPIEKKISVRSLAFLIARKIAQEGTKYYQQGGTDLISSVVTPERMQEILDKAGVFFAREIECKLLERIKIIGF